MHEPATLQQLHTENVFEKWGNQTFLELFT